MCDLLMLLCGLLLVSDAHFAATLTWTLIIMMHGVMLHRVVWVMHHRVRMMVATMHLARRVAGMGRVMVHHHVRGWWMMIHLVGWVSLRVMVVIVLVIGRWWRVKTLVRG